MASAEHHTVGDPPNDATRDTGDAGEVERSDDARTLAIVAVRDVAVLAAAFSLFAAADAWHQLTGTGVTAALSLVDGVLVGFFATGLVHEWGHFLGGRLSGGCLPLKPATAFLPLFDFDYRRNTQHQFRMMSVGGNLAHWLAIAVLVFGLPLATIGQTVLASSAIGFGVFASSIELPVIWRAYQGWSGTDALATIPRNFLQRNGSFGLAAAAVAFLAI